MFPIQLTNSDTANNASPNGNLGKYFNFVQNLTQTVRNRAASLINSAIQPQQQPSTSLGFLNNQGADGHEFDGLCEAYVEQQKYGKTGIYPSAIDAWNNHPTKVQGTAGLEPGDQIFFGGDQSNGGYGHTGIYVGDGKFKSATYNGVQVSDLNNWQKSTGQKVLGYTIS